jgi:hypothetical protein
MLVGSAQAFDRGDLAQSERFWSLACADWLTDVAVRAQYDPTERKPTSRRRQLPPGRVDGD